MRFLRLLCLLLVPLGAAAQDAPPFASFDLAGPAVLNDPHDLALGPDGRIYVADKFGGRIAVLDPETLDLVDVIGEGLMPGVHDVSFGPDGQAAVAVTGLNGVFYYRDLTAAGGKPDAVLPALRTEGALMHSSGSIYATEGGIGGLSRFDGVGTGARPLVLQDPGAPGLGGHPGAHDVAEGPDGSIWIADNFNRRLVRYSADFQLLQVIDDPKFGFLGPRYLDVTPDGLLAVADQDAHRILLIDPAAPEGGALIGVLGTGLPGDEPGQFDDPEGILVVGSRYYIADSDNNRIVRYSVVMN